MLSYFQVEAPIHRPSFFLFFSLTITDKTKISLTIKNLHLGQVRWNYRVQIVHARRRYQNYKRDNPVSMTRRIQNTGQGSFTRKVRTIFTVTIIVSIFVKLFLILVLITLTTIFYRKNFCEKGYSSTDYRYRVVPDTETNTHLKYSAHHFGCPYLSSMKTSNAIKYINNVSWQIIRIISGIIW